MGINFKALGSAVTRLVGKGRLWTRLHEPELWIAGGLAIGVGAVVAAGVQGAKCHDIIENHKKNMESIKLGVEYAEIDNSEYTEKEQLCDTWGFRVETGLELAKKFVVPGLMVVGAGAMIIKGFRVEKARTRAAIHWGMGVMAAFGAYRSRVIEDQGVSADKYYMTGLKDTEIEVTNVDENGKITTGTEVVETGKVAGDVVQRLFTFIFAPGTSNLATYDGQKNLHTLYEIENAAHIRMINKWFCDYNWILDETELNPKYYPPRGYGQMFGAVAEKTDGGGWKRKIHLDAHIIPGRDDGACIVTVEGMEPLTDPKEDVTNVLGEETIGMAYLEDFKDNIDFRGSEFVWGLSEQQRKEAEENRKKLLEKVNDPKE